MIDTVIVEDHLSRASIRPNSHYATFFPPSPFLSSTLLYPLSLSPSLPLKVGSLIQLGVWERCEFPSCVWSRALAEIQFGAF